MGLRRLVFFFILLVSAWALFYTGKPLYFYLFAFFCVALLISFLQLLLSVISFRLKTNLHPRTAEKNLPIGWKLLPRSAFFPVAHSAVYVRFPDLGGNTETTARYYASLPVGHAVPLQVQISSPYSGSFSLEIVKVEFTDVFGLFRVRIPAGRYMKSNKDIVYILPDARLHMRESMMYDEIVTPIRKTRERAEPVGVREYRQDDDFRSIHWKYSARIGKLHVKEYEKGAKDLHVIYLDLVDSPLTGEAGFASRDYLLCAVASFCRELLQEQIPLLLLSYSKDGRTQFSLPHSGRWNASRIFLSRQVFLPEIPSDFQTSVANLALQEKATMTVFSMATSPSSLSFLLEKSADFSSVALCLIPQKGYADEQSSLTHRLSDRGVYAMILPETPPGGTAPVREGTV